MPRLTVDQMIETYDKSKTNTGAKRLSADEMVALYDKQIEKNNYKKYDDLIERTNPNVAAIKAGLGESIGALGRLGSSLGLPDWIKDSAEKLEKSMGLDYEKTDPGISQMATKEFANMLPAMALGGGAEMAIGKGLGMAAEGASKLLPKAVETLRGLINKNKATKYGSALAKTIPGGAAFGAATTSPGEDVSEGLTIGSLVSPIGKAGADVVGATVKGATKHNAIKKIADFFGGDVEELEQVIKDAKGTTPMAGMALQNPNVHKLEMNTLPTVPGFSKDAAKKIQQMGSMLGKQANQLFEKLTNKMDKSEVSNFLENSVVNHVDTLEEENRHLYSMVSEIADNNNLDLKVSKKNLLRNAGLEKNDIERMKRAVGINKRGEASGMLEDILGADKKPLSFRDAIFAKSDLNDLAFKAKHDNDRKMRGLYSKLASSLEKDIQEGLDKADAAGIPELRQAYEDANKFYKENIVPIKDRKIAGIVNGVTDSNTITDTFLPNKGIGRINLLSKFLKNAPDSKKALLTDKLSSSVEQNALGESYINPGKLNVILKNIGNYRMNMLVDNPEMLKEIKRFQNNMTNGYESLLAMLNPKTGYANVANQNIFESTNAMNDLLKDAMSGNKSNVAAKLLSWAQTVANGKAVNDPELLQKIIGLKKGQQVDMGIPYAAAQKLQESSGPLAKLLIGLLNQSQGNE